MEEIEDEMFADLIRLANQAQQSRIKETPKEPQVCDLDDDGTCELCSS